MISILLPIYNGIEFLEESLQSILDQTFTEWELLIGINGHLPLSNVYLKAKSFESLSKKIRVFEFDLNKVKGKSATLNELVKYCSKTFNYIALIDVDDIWHPLKLELQVSIIRLNKYDVIGTNGIYFGDKTGKINIPSQDINHFNFQYSNPIINTSVIIKKELCFWSNDTFIEDYDLWLRLKKQGKLFYNCKENLVNHRIHKSSSFNSKGNSDIVHLKKILNKN